LVSDSSVITTMHVSINIKYQTNFLDSWSLKRRQIGCPEKSVMSYQFSLLINTEQRSSSYQMETQLSWNITACQIINIYRRFERYY